MLDSGKYIFLFIITVIIVSQWNFAVAQSLTGINGLISIPTGYIPEHGEVFIGTNWVDRHYLSYGSGNYDALVNYAAIGYLPFLEIALRATRLMDHPEVHTIGDRMIIVRLRLMRVVLVSPVLTGLAVLILVCAVRVSSVVLVGSGVCVAVLT